MENHDKTGWLAEPAKLTTLWKGFLVLAALVVVGEQLVHMHPHFTIDALFGFHALWGALACALLVVLAKGLAVVLTRPASYYAAAAEPTAPHGAQGGHDA